LNYKGEANLTKIALVSSLVLLLINNVSPAFSQPPEPTLYSEQIILSLDCDTGKLDVSCRLTSVDSTLVYYPSPVDLADAHLKNCTSIVTTFNGSSSILIFTFNDTAGTEAENNAAAIVPSMETAFGITFTYDSTIVIYVPYPYVMVTYIGDSISDMAMFLASLQTSCVQSDVEGFSEVLSTFFTHAETATIVIDAANGTSQWLTMLTAEYQTSFPDGSVEHTIDVLYYLGNESRPLQPSEYAKMLSYYLWSYVDITIYSSNTVSFATCQPDEADITDPGWYITERGPGDTVSGILYFSDDASIGNIVTFTFGGIVLPEPVTLASLVFIVFLTTALVYLRRRHSRTEI
jgi:hypothetical protein